MSAPRCEARASAPRRVHHGQIQPAHLLVVQRQADQAAPVDGHEIHGFGRDALRRDAEIAFVLAILVVDQDHETSGAEIVERLLNAPQVLGRDVDGSNGWRLIYCKGSEGEQLEFVQALGPVKRIFDSAREARQRAVGR